MQHKHGFNKSTWKVFPLSLAGAKCGHYPRGCGETVCPDTFFRAGGGRRCDRSFLRAAFIGQGGFAFAAPLFLRAAFMGGILSGRQTVQGRICADVVQGPTRCWQTVRGDAPLMSVAV